VELAASDVALGVEAGAVLSHRAELRRESLAGLEPVRLRRHVDDRAEARVGDGAVVALEEVLGDELPVRLDARLYTAPELERAHVDADLGDELREPSEGLRERCPASVGIDEDKRAPGADRRRLKGDPGLDPALPLGSRRRE
jgi:hypothetical protein